MSIRPAASSTNPGGSTSPCIPRGVAFTTTAPGTGCPHGTSTAATPSATARAPPAPGRRVDTLRAAPAKATSAAAAAPPPPSSRTGPRPGSPAHSRARCKPPTSVLWPTTAVPSPTRVFTAPPRAASGASRSAAAAAVLLCGMVTLAPRRAPARISAQARYTPAASTRRASYRPSMPTAASAAWWMAGDRECPTGSPRRASLTGSAPPPGTAACSSRNSSKSAVKAWRPSALLST